MTPVLMPIISNGLRAGGFALQTKSYRYDHYWRWQPELPATTTADHIDLVLVFGARSFVDHIEPFGQLARAFPEAVIVGCSTAGEIHQQVVEDETLSVAAVSFERTGLRVASVPISAAHSSQAGADLAAQLMEKSGLAAVMVLSDGLEVNGTDLTDGINATVPDGVVVTGGLAADGDRFESTWVLVDGKPASGHAVAVGFYGDAIRVGHGSMGGWDYFGPERRVTKSAGNILHELDGRPALGLYKEYLGELASGLPATGLLFPLSLKKPGESKSLVRTILGVDHREQSLIFAGDVPEGHTVQLMQANFDSLVDGAEGAAAHAIRNGSIEPSLCVAISCVGRRLVLGERTEDELEATKQAFPGSMVQVGFYSYGEISPYAESTCDLHNQTMTLTTFAEV
jgi:hypothetical protein